MLKVVCIAHNLKVGRKSVCVDSKSVLAARQSNNVKVTRLLRVQLAH